jgi:hypothetical protein
MELKGNERSALSQQKISTGHGRSGYMVVSSSTALG